MDLTEKRLAGVTMYKGIIVSVALDQAELSDGTIVNREVVSHPGGVTVLPVDSDGTCYCVRQYRYPAQQALLEAPAGKLEPGEDPLEAAIRELSEETGLAAGKITYLGYFYTSPGFSTEILHIYLATDLTRGISHPDEGEILQVEKHSIDELVSMCMNGEIIDAKTVIAVLKAKRILNIE